MKVFLAGTACFKNNASKLEKCRYMLESFYYIQDWQIPYLKSADMFLLDSGAFTFMNNSNKTDINWKNYIDRYIAFINKYDIKYFFELDIDSIMGYDNVKKIRSYIEEKTGKKSIPVWHKSRGLQEFIKLTKEYSYIAIGGIVTKEIKQTEYPYLAKLISIAHKNGCNIHGLGFTSLKTLHKYHFDTVDSTSWSSGARFGTVYYYKDGKLCTIPHKNQRLKKNDINAYNFDEWCKFQCFADTYL